MLGAQGILGCNGCSVLSYLEFSWGFPQQNASLHHCVALEGSSQAKTKQDPKLPKRQQFAVNDVHGFHAIERTSLLNDSRLCSEHYEDHCIHESYLLEARIVSFTGE